jgi:hypothetical protein
VTVTNTGTAPETLSAVLGGVDAPSMTIESNSCSVVPLGAGESCSIGIAFQSATAASGGAAAKLLIRDSTARGSRVVDLSGPSLVRPAVSLVASRDPTQTGGSVRFTATVASATAGIVTFTTPTTTLGSAPVDPDRHEAAITVTVPAADTWVTARFGGSISLAPSVSAPLRMHVAP